MRRVAVTGVGAITPFGVGAKAYWAGITAGVRTIRPITLFETTGFRSRIAAEVPELPRGGSRHSRADRLALVAASEALDDARLGRAERAETALVVGAVGGGMLEAEAWYWRRTRGERTTGPPRQLRVILPSAHAEVVSSRLGVHGPRETLVTACSSGAAALALGADLIADGVAELVLAGGADALTRICFMGFNALRLLDPDPCRPFDRDRRGMSIGEGAGFLVLEEAAHAQARGVRPYAELTGHGMTTDAYHVTAPHPEGEGMMRAMTDALAHAGLSARDIGYVNAHGTATLQNDRIEATALRRVFGAAPLLVSATKSMIGHTMAAAGSLEALATVLTLVHDVIPPTAGLDSPDPDMSFDCVPKTAREAAVEHAMSNSFGFGGQNVTLVFSRAVR